MKQVVGRGERAGLLVGGAVGAALLVGSLLVSAGGAPWGPRADLMIVATHALAGVCAVWAALRRPGALGRSWLLFALMCLLNAAGGTSSLVLGAGSVAVVGPSVADALYLGALLAGVAGLLSYPTAAGLRRAWGPILLDGLVLCGSLLLIGAVVGLSQVQQEQSAGEAFVHLIYPVTDVVLLSTLLVLLLRSAGPARLDVVLVGLAFAAFSVADSDFSVNSVQGEAPGGVYHLAYVAAGLLLGAGALTAVTVDSLPPVLQRDLKGPVAPLLPDLAALIALGMCLAYGVTGAVEAVLVGSVLVLGGVRQGSNVVQNLRMRRDLEDRVAQRTEEMRQLTAEHRRLDSMKKEFIINVSHELRTPLTAVRGALEMLADGDAGELPPMARPVLEMASRGSERLTRLVEDIIDLERLENGALRFARGRHALQEVLEEAAGSLALLAADAGVDLSVCPAGTALVRCDRDRLIQALVNLIGNALKFTPAGGTVTVAAETSGAQMCVSVTDTGRGIPADELEAVFDPFHQVEADDARQGAGNGLGLSITRRIVETNGGRIWARSIPGHGSSFSFTVPLDPEQLLSPVAVS